MRRTLPPPGLLHILFKSKASSTDRATTVGKVRSERPLREEVHQMLAARQAMMR